MSGALLLLLVANARAQGVDEATTGFAGLPPPDTLPVAAPLPATPLADGLVWELRGSVPTREALRAVAVEPGPARIWLVGGAGGAVFRSPDAGSSWSLVLPAVEEEAPDDEAILLDAERARDEEKDTSGAGADATDPTEEVPEAEADLAAAGAAAAAAADASTIGIGRDVARRDTLAVWFDPGADAVALVGRADGVWRSTDAGQSWSMVIPDRAATAFLRAGPTVIAAGEGLSVSLDAGETWIDIAGPLARTTVAQLDAGSALYAAAADGLYVSTDTFHWERLPMPGSGPVEAVVADPDWVNGLWAVRGGALYRSDDGGLSFYVAGRTPLADLSRLRHLGEPGHLVASSSTDGVWESLDGGTRWQPVTRLLTEPRVHDLDLVGRRPVIATGNGVWELVAPALLAEEQGPVGPLGMGLGEVVFAALARSGLDLADASLARRAAAYRLTPKLVVGAWYVTQASRDAEFFVEDTVESHDRGFAAFAQICWGACDVLITYSFDDDLEELVAEELVDADLYVIDGEVYVDDDSSAPVAGAANVSQDLSRYRITLAEQVSDAWLARRRLAADGPPRPGTPLREQVLRTLQLAELDARLDAFTGGAFTASLDPESSP